MSSTSLKNIALTVSKLAVAGLLISWLLNSGRLDFRELRVYLDRPSVLCLNVLLWLVAFVLMGSYRWNLLLRGVGIVVSYYKVVRLQMIGFFFNTAMPGAVGGDIIKAVYVMREQRSHGKTRAMLTILLDRLVGLAALFLMGLIAVSLNFEIMWGKPSLRPLVVFILVGTMGVMVAAAIVFLPFKKGDPIRSFLKKDWPAFGLLEKIYSALRSYRRCPDVLLQALLLSVTLQGLGFLFFWYLTLVLTESSPPISLFAAIYSVGIMTTAIPLAPGGLGVGHVAFDGLFSMIGLSGGANVFNVMVLGQLSLHLLGFIPYLLYRTELPVPERTDLPRTVN